MTPPKACPPPSSFYFISFSGTSGLDTPGPIHSHHPLLRLHLLPFSLSESLSTALLFQNQTCLQYIARISRTELVVFYLELLVEIRAGLRFSLFTSLMAAGLLISAGRGVTEMAC